MSKAEHGGISVIPAHLVSLSSLAAYKTLDQFFVNISGIWRRNSMKPALPWYKNHPRLKKIIKLKSTSNTQTKSRCEKPSKNFIAPNLTAHINSC